LKKDEKILDLVENRDLVGGEFEILAQIKFEICQRKQIIGGFSTEKRGNRVN